MSQTLADRPARPGWVWAIALYMLLGAASALYSIYLTTAIPYPLDSGQQPRFEPWSNRALLISVLTALIKLGISVALLRLSKLAVPLLAAQTLISSLALGWSIVANDMLVLGNALFIGTAIEFAVLGAALIYARNVSYRGVLT